MDALGKNNRRIFIYARTLHVFYRGVREDTRSFAEFLGHLRCGEAMEVAFAEAWLVRFYMVLVL